MSDQPPVVDPVVTQSSGRLGALWLWASAAVLAGLIVVQAGRLTGGTPAFADVLATGGDMAILTVDGSAGDDLIVVLDNRSEDLLVYGARNQMSLELRSVQNLREIFQTARAAGGRRTK